VGAHSGHEQFCEDCYCDFVVIVIVMFIIFNAWISYRFYKQQRRNAKSWKLLVITRLSFHIIVNLVVKLPGIHFTKPSVTPMSKSLYTFDTIIIFCSFLRMIYCLNLFQNYDQQVKEYHIFNVDVYLGKREFLKSIQYRYRSHNKLFILCVLLIPFFFLSLLVKIVEQSSDSEDQSFNSVYNSYWVIILSMTTVGYGDVYPVTQTGRFFCLVALVTGNIGLTLLTMSFLNSLKMKQGQK